MAWCLFHTGRRHTLFPVLVIPGQRPTFNINPYNPNVGVYRRLFPLFLPSCYCTEVADSRSFQEAIRYRDSISSMSMFDLLEDSVSALEGRELVDVSLRIVIPR